MKRPARISLPTKPMHRLATGILVLAVIATGAVIGVKKFTGLPSDAAFKYAGSVVTQSQLHARVELLGALYGIKAPTGAAKQDTFRRDTAKAVAVSMILDHLAAARGIVIADKAARDTLATMLTTDLGSDAQAQFVRILGKFGVNENDVLDEIKRQQATALLFQQITKSAVASVTPMDALAYFDMDPARFAVPEKRQLANIVVATRSQAVQLLSEARAGRNFAALASRYSLDQSTSKAGGSLGNVTAAQLDTSYASEAFSTAVGQEYGPVQTKFGWNIGRVVAITPGTQATFASVSSQVLQTLQSQRAMKVWQSFLASQIKAADVVYAASYLPAHPDAPPSTQPGVATASAAVSR